MKNFAFSKIALIAVGFIIFADAVKAQNSSYEDQDTVTTDGPIIYGTDLSEEDRQKAWKHFFLMMVQACGKQQGNETLGIKLARRCKAGQDFCLTVLDANLVGVGGINEPRKTIVMVATDLKDKNKQLSRTVCTYPAPGVHVCRDWDTGKLMRDDDKQ